MRAFSISSDGKLVVTASESSSKNDFDYLIGSWNIKNRTLKEPLAGSDEWKDFDATQDCRQVLLGLGNLDVFRTELDGKPFEGLTVRLFDPDLQPCILRGCGPNVGMELDLEVFTTLIERSSVC
jgi:hypothetical protein